MTTHALPQGTVDNAAAAPLTPKVEPAPTPLTLDEFLSSIPDSRILQAAAFAIYNNVSSRIAYIALGIASKMAATERAASTEPLGMQDVLKELEEDAERARVMDLMGLEYTDRATTIGKLLRVRQDMHELIEQHWQGFQGRSLDVELARTTQPRAVNPRDVDALFQHFDGELDKNSITHGLNARARTDAERNAERLHLANMIITGIDVADEGTELDAADLQRVYERVRGALMQFETDCLTGKAGGFANLIESMATATVSKRIRKGLDAMLARPQFNRGQAVPSGTKPEAPVNVKSQVARDAQYTKALEGYTDPLLR
jgi:hypothetical protein